MVMPLSLPPLPRAFRPALQILGVVALVLLLWLHLSAQRQRASEQELQGFRLLAGHAQHRIDMLTGQVTTLLRVMQVIGGTPLEGEASRAWMQPFRQILVDDPLIAGLTVVDQQGRSWGVGKFRGDGWVRVTPFRDEPGFQNLQFDDARGNTDATHVVSNPRLVSPWFQVMALREGQILWTTPFTSAVISEPVISAAIKGRQGVARAYAAHIRLADLQVLSDAPQILPNAAVILTDRQGRLVARAAAPATPDVPNASNARLLASISEQRLEPFNALQAHWLKAGKPLRTVLRFESFDGSTEYSGWVSPVAIDGLEFYLMAALPQPSHAWSGWSLGAWLLPAARRGEKAGTEKAVAER